MSESARGARPVPDRLHRHLCLRVRDALLHPLILAWCADLMLGWLEPRIAGWCCPFFLISQGISLSTGCIENQKKFELRCVFLFVPLLHSVNFPLFPSFGPKITVWLFRWHCCVVVRGPQNTEEPRDVLDRVGNLLLQRAVLSHKHTASPTRLTLMVLSLMESKKIDFYFEYECGVRFGKCVQMWGVWFTFVRQLCEQQNI